MKTYAFRICYPKYRLNGTHSFYRYIHSYDPNTVLPVFSHYVNSYTFPSVDSRFSFSYSRSLNR